MSISRPFALALLAGGAGAALPAAAQPRLAASTEPTIVQTGSAVYRFGMFTAVSHDGQRHYDVTVGIPKRPPPAKGYPVVYLLDGGAAVETLDEGLLKRLDAGGGPPVLVAIGYVGQPRFDVRARAYDYTPPDPGRPGVVDDQGRPGGGADAFLQLLERRIAPKAGKLAPIDRRRQTLWGHSYGGLLVLHAAIARAPRFQHFAAADPALWWNYGSALREAQGFAAERGGSPRTIDIMVGGNEKRTRDGMPPGGAAMRTSVPPQAAQALAEQLRATGNRIRFSRCEGAGHGDMFRISLMRTLLDTAHSDSDGDAPLSCVVTAGS
ncbi:MAG: alpha/beta hydrolase-fold protein [Sphingomonas bacterium]